MYKFNLKTIKTKPSVEKIFEITRNKTPLFKLKIKENKKDPNDLDVYFNTHGIEMFDNIGKWYHIKDGKSALFEDKLKHISIHLSYHGDIKNRLTNVHFIKNKTIEVLGENKDKEYKPLMIFAKRFKKDKFEQFALVQKFDKKTRYKIWKEKIPKSFVEESSKKFKKIEPEIEKAIRNDDKNKIAELRNEITAVKTLMELDNNIDFMVDFIEKPKEETEKITEKYLKKSKTLSKENSDFKKGFIIAATKELQKFKHEIEFNIFNLSDNYQIITSIEKQEQSTASFEKQIGRKIYKSLVIGDMDFATKNNASILIGVI